MEFQFNKIKQTLWNNCCVAPLGGERLFFQDHWTPPKFPKKRDLVVSDSRFGGWVLASVASAFASRGRHGGGWGFGREGGWGALPTPERKKHLAKVWKNISGGSNGIHFQKKHVFEMFEVFYLWVYIIKVNSIESTWVTNNGEVGCPVEDWPDSMDSMENAQYFPNQNDMFGFVGNNIRVESEGKISNLRKQHMFSWLSNHGDFPCLTKRNKNQTRADMMPGSIWKPSLIKQNKKSSTCEGSMTSTMSVLDVFQVSLHNQAKLHALNYKRNPAKLPATCFSSSLFPPQKMGPILSDPCIFWGNKKSQPFSPWTPLASVRALGSIDPGIHRLQPIGFSGDIR